MSELRNYVHATQTTLSALARRAGVSPAQLSRVASGKSTPSPGLAQRLEKATAGRVNAGRLLGLHTGDGDRPESDKPYQHELSLADAIKQAQRVFADRSDADRNSADRLRIERTWEFQKEELEMAEMKLGHHRP